MATARRDNTAARGVERHQVVDDVGSCKIIRCNDLVSNSTFCGQALREGRTWRTEDPPRRAVGTAREQNSQRIEETERRVKNLYIQIWGILQGRFYLLIRVGNGCSKVYNGQLAGNM